MAMSHSGLEMRRTFLNPFSNWHTSALQLVVVVAAIMLSLVPVDELPVPPQKEKLRLPVPNVVKPHGRSVPN